MVIKNQYRRKVKVIEGNRSQVFDIKGGVRQGSILGPILFLIFINDIVNEIVCNIKIFADDTSLYIVVEDEYASAELLNSDIGKIHQWSEQWLVNFNAQKTETMTISKKVIKPHHPPVYMNDNIIKEVENQC